MNDLSNKKFKIIYADPPWQFKNKRTGGSMCSGADHHYNTMSIDDICNMGVSEIADEDSVLFMWWIASMPEEALRVVDAWGFKLKTMTAFVWNKRTKNNKPHFGMGHWTRAGAECCLLATRGKPKPVSHSVRSVISAYTFKHSQKPWEVAERIVELCGDVPRVELFARDIKPGWYYHGEELIDIILK